jgi:hypothetical protein
LVVALHGIAAGIGSYGAVKVTLLLMTTVSQLIGWFVWAGVTFLVGTKLLPERSTKSDMGELLRTIGFAASPGLLLVLGIIPGLGGVIEFIVQIWMLIAFVVAVRQALDYSSTLRAVIVCVIGWILMVFISLFTGIIFGKKFDLF